MRLSNVVMAYQLDVSHGELDGQTRTDRTRIRRMEMK